MATEGSPASPWLPDEGGIWRTLPAPNTPITNILIVKLYSLDIVVTCLEYLLCCLGDSLNHNTHYTTHAFSLEDKRLSSAA